MREPRAGRSAFPQAQGLQLAEIVPGGAPAGEEYAWQSARAICLSTRS